MSAQPDLAAGRPAGARWRTLRWLVPVAALCAAALLVDGILSADAKPTLPSRSPAQLLASVSATEPPGFSGTVVARISLGLPQLGLIPGLGSDQAFGALSLLSGSHNPARLVRRPAPAAARGARPVRRDGPVP